MKYVEDKGGEVKWLGGLRRSRASSGGGIGNAADDFVHVLGPASNGSIFVSFDLDSECLPPAPPCPSPPPRVPPLLPATPSTANNNNVYWHTHTHCCLLSKGIAGRDMPGVSCPSPVGLTAEEASDHVIETNKPP